MPTRRKLHRAGLTRLILVASLLVPAIVPAAKAQSGVSAEIRQMLEQRDRQIKSLLGKGTLGDAQRDQLKDLINGVIDFRAMGQEALGPHWADLTEAQKTEFVDVFSDIVRSQSVSNLEVYRSRVTYGDISVEDSEATVATTTYYKDTDTPVVYKMHEVDGEWLVTDIILNDVSTAEGYARSFQGLVRKRGFDVLMEKLRARRDQT